MSKFSGKCDFYDEIGFLGLDKILKYKIYVGKSKEPLYIEGLKDCIPYYPYVVSASFWNGDTGVIYLTSKSWVDIEEERYGYMGTHDYYRRELKKEMEKYKEKSREG